MLYIPRQMLLKEFGMMKGLIFTCGILFSITSFASNDIDTLISVDCADSLYETMSKKEVSSFGKACIDLYEKDPNKSVLSILEEALATNSIPPELSEDDVILAISKIKETKIIGSKIFLKENYLL